MTDDAPRTGYAPVNGLDMYYEIHGGGDPLVVLHGAFMSTGTMGPIVPALAETRQVIAADLQAHGRTADIDRPLSYEHLADDVAALIEHLGLGRADIFGYSKGGQAALRLAMRRPELVRKLVVVSTPYATDGTHPEIRAVSSTLTAEALAETPWKAEYDRIAPNPQQFPELVAKMTQLDSEEFSWPPAELRDVVAPTLVVIGDADIVRPEHAVELLRLLGGGVPGDLAGLPNARLAVLPGTTHIGMIERHDWLLPMIVEFLDAPPAGGR